MIEFEIELTEEAKTDLYYYSVFKRKMITEEIRAQLTHQPLVESRKWKKLRDNPIATWELRSGKYRIFYEVAEFPPKITIVAIGHKEQNKLLIKEKEAKYD